MLSLRMTPRTRYGLDLLARVNRMSLSQVVELALENAFRGERMYTLESRSNEQQQRVNVLDATWAERPWVRLAQLALVSPELLSFREVRLWETVKETKYYWTADGPPSERKQVADRMNHKVLQGDWDELCAVCEVGF